MTDATPWVLLAFAGAVIGVILRQGDKGFRAFETADRAQRRRLYRRVIVGQIVLFAWPALLTLAVLHRAEAIAAMPVELWAAVAVLGMPYEGSPWVVAYYTGCVALGLVLGAAINGVRRRRGWRPAERTARISALLPRDRVELFYGAGVSLAAGICEELFFRLMLPLLLVGVGLPAWVAFVLATAAFGLVHRYQTWVGVVVTSLVGAMLTVVYLTSGSLGMAMLVHVLIDLNALVLRPALRGAWPRTGR